MAACTLPCLLASFISFYSVWPPSLRRDEAKTQSSQLGISVICFLPLSLAIQQSHVLQGHSSLSQPTTSSLFSQQGIAFPVLALVLAYITSFSPPPAASCFAWVLGSLHSRITQTKALIFPQQLAGWVALLYIGFIC